MRKNISRCSCVLLCALPLIVLILWIVALSSLATAGGTATAEAPARISVPIPAAAKSAAVVMLEMSIAVTRKAPAAHLDAVVRVRPSGGSAVEVGRVSIGARRQLSVQCGVRAWAESARYGRVEVSVIDRGGGPPPSGAALSIGRA